MKKIFFAAFVLFVSFTMYGFTTFKTIHNKSNKIAGTLISKEIDHHFVFNNTYIGTLDGCKVFFTGTITFCEDGTYFFQDDSYLVVDCRPNIITVSARISEDRSTVISSTYIDQETEEELGVEESVKIDGYLLVLVNTIKE